MPTKRLQVVIAEAGLASRRAAEALIVNGEVRVNGVFVTVLISSIAGSIVGLTWAFFAKKDGILKLAIPYGPFLVIGVLYQYLLGTPLWLPFMRPM